MVDHSQNLKPAKKLIRNSIMASILIYKFLFETYECKIIFHWKAGEQDKFLFQILCTKYINFELQYRS